jgi:hypothetical protein
MFFTFLGTLMVGVFAASLVLVVTHMSGRKAAKWLYPAAAGLAMIAFHIYQDYFWGDFTAAGLPKHIVVADRHTSSHPLQPWTLIAPTVDRLAAVDTSTVKRNPKVPGLAMAEIILLTRYYPTAKSIQLYDCVEPRRMDIDARTSFDENGAPRDPQWVVVAKEDGLRRVVCATAARLE